MNINFKNDFDRKFMDLGGEGNLLLMKVRPI